jgi:DNA polymerase I-like protein with 3'-5' exonuclease and polymerase domains
VVIKEKTQLWQAANFIADNQRLSFDIETTGLNPRKDAIIGFSIGNATDAVYIAHLAWDGEKLVELVPKSDCVLLLRSLLGRRLITWNGSFDFRFIYHYFGIELWHAMETDAMLAKHTVQEEGPFDLKGSAASLLGTSARQEQVELTMSLKAAGAGPKEFYKADLSVLAKYGKQDAILTYKLADHFLAQIKAEGLEKFFFEDEVMPLYREVTIPMELRGIPVNVEAMQAAHAEISIELAKRETQVLESMKPHLGAFMRRFLNSQYPPSPRGKFAQELAKILEVKLPLTSSGKLSLSKAGLEQLPYNDLFRAFIEGRGELPDSLVLRVQKALHGEEPRLNLYSKDQLRYVFFTIFREQPTSFTDKGVPKVDENFLESIKSKYEFVPQLLAFNKLSKIKSTYIERFLEAQEDGIFYPSFQQHRTTSGRYGGDLQQLPKILGPEDEPDETVRYFNNMVRGFFIAGPGQKLIDADYSSLEVVVFADDAGDESLLNMIKQDLDFYSVVAIEVHGLQDQFSADKKASNFLKKHAPHLRQAAKVFGLGIRYGMGDWKLSKTLNIEQDEAKQIIERYFAAYPKLREKMEFYATQAKTLGYVESKAGRRRHLPEAKSIYEQYGDEILDSLVLWKKYHHSKGLYESMKRIRRKFNNILNNALNFPIQSLAASIVSQSSIALARAMRARGLKAYICMNVHDEICIRAPESEVEVIKPLMKQIMENTIKLNAPLTADPQVGDNYGEVK